MRYNDIFSLLDEYFDKQRCWDFVRSIYETDRWFRFSSFVQTADTCVRILQKAGLAEVEKLELAADGKTAYGDWVIPRAWDAESAILKIIAPGCVSDGKVLADYKQTPCSLVMYSAPTCPSGITGEVVQIDDPFTYSKNAVCNGTLKGKLIFTCLPAKELVELAVKGEAAGIVTDFIPLYPGVRDSRCNIKNASRWENDFIVPINETGLFAFSLSPENGDYLRSVLADSKGIVSLYANVNTRFYDGKCYTISGAIPGEAESNSASEKKSKQEICIYGHLYEQGANDNASGCGLILELACCLSELIRSGRLPQPKRTIRFIMGYECTGSMGYICAHPERIQNTVCGIVADMVGTEAIDNAQMGLWHNPLSNWSFVDTLILDINSQYQKYKGAEHPWQEKPFSVGSDNIMGDPVWNMPTVAMITEPALSYHSSMDCPERIDPDILKRNGIIIGTYLYFISQAGADEAGYLLSKMEAHLLDKITFHNINDCADTAGSKTGYYLLRQAFSHAISSLRILLDPDNPADRQKAELLQKHAFHLQNDLSVLKTVEDQQSKYKYIEELLLSPPDEIKNKGGCKVPLRKVHGCLTFAPRPELTASKWNPAWNDKLNLPLLWANGERTLWAISILTSLETGKYTIEGFIADFNYINDYFNFLAANGYLSWNSK